MSVPGGADAIDLERFRDALRTHPDVASPHLEVLDVGDRIVISGTVPSTDQRRAVDAVAAELAPGRDIDNRVRVGGDPLPGEEKQQLEF